MPCLSLGKPKAGLNPEHPIAGKVRIQNASKVELAPEVSLGNASTTTWYRWPGDESSGTESTV